LPSRFLPEVFLFKKLNLSSTFDSSCDYLLIYKFYTALLVNDSTKNALSSNKQANALTHIYYSTFVLA
jgi:hypothetical protein